MCSEDNELLETVEMRHLFLLYWDLLKSSMSDATLLSVFPLCRGLAADGLAKVYVFLKQVENVVRSYYSKAIIN